MAAYRYAYTKYMSISSMLISSILCKHTLGPNVRMLITKLYLYREQNCVNAYDETNLKKTVRGPVPEQRYRES